MNLNGECAARGSTLEAVAAAVGGPDNIKILSRSVCAMFCIIMERAPRDVTKLKLPLLNSCDCACDGQCCQTASLNAEVLCAAGVAALRANSVMYGAAVKDKDNTGNAVNTLSHCEDCATTCIC